MFLVVRILSYLYLCIYIMSMFSTWWHLLFSYWQSKAKDTVKLHWLMLSINKSLSWWHSYCFQLDSRRILWISSSTASYSAYIWLMAWWWIHYPFICHLSTIHLMGWMLAFGLYCTYDRYQIHFNKSIIYAVCRQCIICLIIILNKNLMEYTIYYNYSFFSHFMCDCNVCIF